MASPNPNGRMISAPTEKRKAALCGRMGTSPLPQMALPDPAGRMISAPTNLRNTQRRGEEPCLPTPLLTGAEAKRSFAQSSLPSFLSRKRGERSFSDVGHSCVFPQAPPSPRGRIMKGSGPMPPRRCCVLRRTSKNQFRKDCFSYEYCSASYPVRFHGASPRPTDSV